MHQPPTEQNKEKEKKKKEKIRRRLDLGSGPCECIILILFPSPRGHCPSIVRRGAVRLRRAINGRDGHLHIHIYHQAPLLVTGLAWRTIKWQQVEED
jgi:hypothetical protein